MTPQPQRRQLLIIGVVLFVLAMAAALLSPDRDERPARTAPSGETQPDRPRP